MHKFLAAVAAAVGRVFADTTFKLFCVGSFLVGAWATVRAAQLDVTFWTPYGHAQTAMIFQAGVFVLACLAALVLRRKKRWAAFGLYSLALSITGFNVVSIVGFSSSERIAPVEIARANQQKAADAAIEAADATNASNEPLRAQLQRQIDGATCTMKDRVRRGACIESRTALIQTLASMPTAVAQMPQADVHAVDAQALALSRASGWKEEDITFALILAQALGLIALAKILPPLGIYLYPSKAARREEEIVATNDNAIVRFVEAPPVPEAEVEIIQLRQTPPPIPANAPMSQEVGDRIVASLKRSVSKGADDQVEKVFAEGFRPVKSAMPWSGELVYKQYRKTAKRLGQPILTAKAFHHTVQRLADLKRVRVARLVEDETQGTLTYFGIAPVIEDDVREEVKAQKAA